MRNFVSILFLLLCIKMCLLANDGAYYGGGNQLIPISETDISVKKEILEIKRKNKKQVDVSVYYEFYNAGNPKNIIVGFEAFSPFGDVNPEPKDGGHPNIYNFTVNMNDYSLSHDIAIVKDSVYYQNGGFNALNKNAIQESMDDYGGMGADFFYVYHFKAPFRKGLNIVKHTYTYDLSGSVDFDYSFDYVLTAAMRWGNKQIDDFTLIIDMGEFQEFYIDDEAFGHNPEWLTEGIVFHGGSYEYTDYRVNPIRESSKTNFAVRKGKLIFKSKNFKPQSELYIRSPLGVAYTPQPFDYKEHLGLAYNLVDAEDYTLETTDDISRRIIRNLPFARRGYIFTSPELQSYYSNQYWYKGDPEYKADLYNLPQEEQAWVLRHVQ